MKIKLIQTTEGKAKLQVPKESFKDPFHLPVFYNPAMRFNRSISSVALGCALPLLEDSIVLDGLCALGSRGIRYAKENKLKKVYFVDANPDAITALKKNITLNKIWNAAVEEEDLNKFFLNTTTHFDFIEIDPFGSSALFLQNAIRKLKKTGILSITGTDLANLAGGRVDPCIKHYGARPLRCEYSHEIALRILVGKIAKELIQQDFGCTPLISFYKGHSIKSIVLCEKNADKADGAIKNLGFVMHCPKCLNRKVSKRQIEKCGNCGNNFEYAGEMWIGKLQDDSFLKDMKALNLKRGMEDQAEVGEMIGLLSLENEFRPSFFDIHVLSSKYHFKIRKTREIVQLLRNKGYNAAMVHYTPLGIKTDAPIGKLVELLKG